MAKARDNTRPAAEWGTRVLAVLRRGVPGAAPLKQRRVGQTVSAPARDNARPAAAEWGSRGPRVAVAWGSGRSPV